MTLQLPHLMISWYKNTGLDVTLKKTLLLEDNGLVIGCDDYKPEPKIFNMGYETVVVIGCPIINDKIDHEAAAQGWFSDGDDSAFLKKLNGQFILVKTNSKNNSLVIAGDRFNGIPLYWADIGDRFIASTLYFDLIKEIKKSKKITFHGEPMFEFIWLQRVMGEKTYDDFTHFLTAASCLYVDQLGSKISRFWKPDFTNKSHATEDELGKEFTELLQQSVKRLTSDDKRYGLFLSGGHDSRVLLSAFNKAPVCFTVGYSDNYEVECARQAATIVDAEHHYLELAEDNLIRYQDSMAQLCGGMFATDNAFFMGLKEKISPYAEVLFHGHAFDYLFQGMYLPSEVVHWFARPTFFKKLQPIKGDITSYFLNQISFREKDVPLLNYVLADKKNDIESWLYESVQDIVDDGDSCCATDYDRWEYLIVHSLGRHYSRPNIDSKMTITEQRVASFDNDLFDYYCHLPTEKRLYAQMMRYTLQHLHPALANIPTGNYGLPAGGSPLCKTMMLITRKIRRHLTGNSDLHAPDATDRTWPDRDSYIRQHAIYKQRALDAVRSEHLHTIMPFMDWNKIQKDTDLWLSDVRYGGAKFLVSLMSLDRFINQVD